MTKYNLRYILPICPQAFHGQICTKFGIEVMVVDVMALAKFFVNPKRTI